MSPFWILLELKLMEVVVTTGAVRHAKLQSYRHHQKTNTQFFTGRMPFLSPNQPTVSKHCSCRMKTFSRVHLLQMFSAITRLVLKAKKAQQARLMQAHVSDTVRLAAGSTRSSKRKKKCCWTTIKPLLVVYFLSDSKCQNYVIFLRLMLYTHMHITRTPNPNYNSLT